jgi:peptide/nickel transport system ATP-binding protein
MTALSISGLTVAARSGSVLLKDVSLEIHPGEAVGLVGTSGSGKTLTALAGIGMMPAGVARTAGTTHVAGTPTHALRPAALRRLLRERVGYVPQDPLAAFDPLFQVGNQITEPLRISQGAVAREAMSGVGLAWPDPGRQARAEQMLQAVGIAGERARQYPHQFSGGMRQRALIASATGLAPALIVADEPTTALDVSLERQILDLLARHVRDRGAALLLISHDLNLVAWYCDRAYVMADGAVVEHGTVQALFRNPRHQRTRALVTARSHSAAPLPRPAPAGEALLRLDGISRRYRLPDGQVVTACRAVSLEVRRGEWLGLLGESGSGKSTLARLALALERPDAGTVQFGGEDLGRLRPAALRALRRRFQPVFQDPLSSLNPRWRVGRSILHPLRIHGLGRWRSRREALEALCAEVALPPSLAARYPHELSGGQRQRACIARALATGPELLVADEALASLDVATQAALLGTFERLRASGMAILFITHDLRSVRAVADRVAVMAQGELVACGPTAEVLGRPADKVTAALMASLLPSRFPTELEPFAP